MGAKPKMTDQNPFEEKQRIIPQEYKNIKEEKERGLNPRTKMLLIIMLICFTVLLLIWSAWAFGFTSGRDVGLAFCTEQNKFLADNAWRLP